jgi:F-type H+-transporting ATPase subunit b
MKRSIFAALFVGAMVLTPVTAVVAQEHGETAEAAHGEDHGLSVRDVVGTTDFKGALVNFCLLLALFIYMGRKPVTKFFQDRRAMIENELQEAARLKEEAEAKHAEYTERLEKLDEELTQIREDMAAAGEKERDRIVAEAESKAARLRKDTEFVIEQQMKLLREELTEAAVAAAVTTAREVLAKETSAADQQRLADEYLKRLHDRMDDAIDSPGGV